MTNILTAIVLCTVQTNWTSVGEWHPLPSGQIEIVEHGFLVTNRVAVFEWSGQRKELQLESVYSGENIAERKIPKPWSQPSPFLYSPGSYMTNLLNYEAGDMRFMSNGFVVGGTNARFPASVLRVLSK